LNLFQRLAFIRVRAPIIQSISFAVRFQLVNATPNL
jgi:hypothetical protein